jgi:acetolactate synthase-1/2/3 large subunit
MNKKVSDLVAEFLATHPELSRDVFLVSGGGNMHLIDSVGRHDGLRYTCNHHEQACTFAAEGYARISNRIGTALVTTGPGGTNALTGVYSAWVDSIPTLTLSGQVKFETTIASHPDLKLRQLGDQEVNIIEIVRPVTKYAVMVTRKEEILYHLERAVYEAKSGRPGPVWIDIPLDIQGARVDPATLHHFTPPSPPKPTLKIRELLTALSRAKRPVIIAGNGLTLSDAQERFYRLLERLQIPVIGTFARYDILRNDHPLFFGRYGTVGHRMANFTVQNADFVLALGARMNIRAVSYNWEYFAREAFIAAVDIDENELKKRTVRVDLPIHADVGAFLDAFLEEIDRHGFHAEYTSWIQQCNRYRSRYPTLENHRRTAGSPVDSYHFFDRLSDAAGDDAVFVFGNGTACVSSYQSLRLRGEQRVVVNSGSAAMGYDLPAAIGAARAAQGHEILCVTGEGSLQMNLQELQTILHYRLPIKLFVLNNGGYISIRNTQNNFFGGFKVGADLQSGVSFPDLEKLATAYGFPFFRIDDSSQMEKTLREIHTEDGPLICEVMLSPEEKMEPKLSSEVKPDGRIVSKPLEDMYPFLDREEFRNNMIVKCIDDA